MTESTVRRWSLWAAVILAVAVVGAEWLGPRLVAAAYREESLRVLNDLIAGRDEHDLSFYIAAWKTLSRAALAGAALAALLLAVLIRYRGKIRVGMRAFGAGEPRLRASTCLGVAAWFGVVGGALEVGHTAIRHSLDPRPADTFGIDFLWLGPIASSAAYLVMALAALGLLTMTRALAGSRANGIPLRPAVFTGAFLAFYGILADPDMHLATYASVLLAGGLAATATRLAMARAPALQKLVRVTAPVLAAAVALAMTTHLASRSAFVEGRRLAGLPPPGPNRLNVLLIILDTVRADGLEVYGYRRPTTPHLRTLADSGTVFERAVATAPWTLTSHTSMFTGRLPPETSAGFLSPLDDEHATLAGVLSANGYATAGFSANHLYTSRASGLGRGFLRYEARRAGWARFLVSSWPTRSASGWLSIRTRHRWGLIKKTASVITDDFLDWLGGASPRPFFAFLNYMDPHAPYLPPEPHRSRFFEEGMDPERRKRPGLTPRDVRGPRALYDGSIAYVDEQLARIREELRAKGLAENTLVIVTSDHGEQFGEHGLIDHANSLYLPLLHVPLVLLHPGTVPAGRRVGPTVSLADLPATILDLVGLDSSPFPGRSMRELWRSSSAIDRPAFSQLAVLPDARPWEPTARGPMSSVIIGDLHVIRNGDGRLELYDHGADPAEEIDLGQSPAAAACAAVLGSLADSAMTHGSGFLWSEELRRRLSAACEEPVG